MNKDEAEKCIEVGLTALKQGDNCKAVKFFQKSIRLHPTVLAQQYLKVALTKPQTPIKQEAAQKTAPTIPSASKYTQDQENMCRQILQKKDFYDILGIGKNASQDEIKKSYRKLALKLHPDKNHAPSASEAFKKINKSFACLSDEIKRRTYDQTGQEEVHGIEMNHYNQGDFAEHIFREFFNESFFSSSLNK